MARVPRIGGGVTSSRRPPAGRSDVPPHFCPGCGTERKAFMRYPWHLCPECCDRAEDFEGRRLTFSNQTIFGGFAWFYADDPTRWDPRAREVRCLISRRLVFVCEARFGGVVAQPLNTRPGPGPGRHSDDNVVDLTDAGGVEKAFARLVPVKPPE